MGGTRHATTLPRLTAAAQSYEGPKILLAAAFNQGITVFFFQAEDGIRDIPVTGVQTCALPTSIRRSGRPSYSRTTARARRAAARGSSARSEERRVGKECRSRWSPDH